ncbi:MAG: hypothetical protein ABIF71_05075 [Planctomycetota bacterium]
MTNGRKQGKTGRRLLVIVYCVSTLAVAFLLAVPVLREGGRRMVCYNTMRSITVACAMYAMSWQEVFPGRLHDLMPDQISDEDIFRCKGNPVDPVGYVYLSGLTANSPVDCAIMFDRKGNHPGGRNVGYIDAHAHYFKEAAFRQELARLLGPEHRKYYAPEAIAIMEEAAAGRDAGAFTRPLLPTGMAAWGLILVIVGGTALTHLIVVHRSKSNGDQPSDHQEGTPC